MSTLKRLHELHSERDEVTNEIEKIQFKYSQKIPNDMYLYKDVESRYAIGLGMYQEEWNRVNKQIIDDRVIGLCIEERYFDIESARILLNMYHSTGSTPSNLSNSFINYKSAYLSKFFKTEFDPKKSFGKQLDNLIDKLLLRLID